MKFGKSAILYIGLFLITLSIFLLLIWKNFSEVSITVFIGLLLYVLLLLGLFLVIDTNTANSDREVGEFYSALRQSLLTKSYNFASNEGNTSETEETTDVLELMSINMKEIKEYYVLSKNMAKSSFRLSVSMCLLGFTLIASSIISVFILDAGLGSALIPSIGGAIVEVVAGTSLLVYKQALDQLNKYYEALHENECFLSVVNITDKISPEKKDDVYIEIIRSQLGQKEPYS